MWAHTNSAVNAVVLGLTHSGFQKTYKSPWKKLCGSSKTEAKDEASQSPNN